MTSTTVETPVGLRQAVSTRTAEEWPVLRSYEGRHLDRVAVPLGGIGTGCVSLGGRGDLRDWEIGNRPAKGFRPSTGFFALRVELPDGQVITRVAEGPISPELYEGADGSPAPHAGLPRFAEASCDVAYPFARVRLRDPQVPLSVTLEAFNPLTPPDSEGSGHPAAILRYRVRNPLAEPVSVSISGNLQNFIGSDLTRNEKWRNSNSAVDGDGLAGILLTTGHDDHGDELWGSMALSVAEPQSVSRRTSWLPSGHFYHDDVLDFWDDFSGSGEVHERESEDARPIASLCERRTIAPGEEIEITFLLTWHFPNRRAWSFDAFARAEYRDETVGNHYAESRSDAWDAAQQLAPHLAELELRSRRFVEAVCEASIPESFKEAALFNLSTLKTQTCFRTADGNFFGWEGTFDDAGSCPGSCTHVWNYEQTTGYLFGDLARSMRRIEYGPSLDSRGRMSFRVGLPLATQGDSWGIAAADGQMGCLVKLYRDWQLSGDDAFLRELWPAAKSSLEFAWIPGGWDADCDGVMEGCQHNTLDIDYYGPNPHMAPWYLAALKAASHMAEYLGDKDFAAKCADLAVRGREWIDDNLWNGEYYIQQIRPPRDFASIAPGVHSGITSELDDPNDPPFQLGEGCAIDQMTGQAVASLVGLGNVLDESHLSSAIDAIMRYNFRDSFAGHFNHMRSFVLEDEAGVLIVSYPTANRPKRPSPYYTEVMTGYEYVLALGALYQNKADVAETIVESIRERYDGYRRNPLNEAECGHHYARAMAAWALPLAVARFGYSGPSRHMSFGDPGDCDRWVWSTGGAWGRFSCEIGSDGSTVNVITVEAGEVEVATVSVGSRTFQVEGAEQWSAGTEHVFLTTAASQG